MASTTNDQIAQANAMAQGVDGGLNVKTDPQRLAPPATTRSDNAWYISAGAVDQLPAFQSTMPAGFAHVYNLSAKDTMAPTLAGDTLVHGELPDPTGSFTTPVWAMSNGTTPSRFQPALPHQLRTRTFASALQRPLNSPADPNVDRWPLLTARQEQATTAGRRMATGYYDGSSLKVTFGNVDGLADTGELLVLSFSAQWVEMIGIQGTPNWGLTYLSGGSVYCAVYDFYGNVVTSLTAVYANALTTNAVAYGATQFPTLTTYNHCQTTYVAYLAQLSTAGSGVSSYCIYTFPFLNVSNKTLLSGPYPAQPGGPLQGFAISSPTSHQPRGSQDYLAVAYDGYVWVIANPFGGGTYASYQSGQLPVAGNTGVGTASTGGFNNALVTLTAMPINDGLYASTAAAGVAVVVYRHCSEQVSPQGFLSGGAAYQYVAVEALSYLNGTLSIVNSNGFRTVGGAAICAKAFAVCPPEANYAGAQAAVQGYCVVRQGAYQPSSYAGTPSGLYGFYDQPMYFLIDHQARIVARWSEGLGPIGQVGDVAASQGGPTQYTYFATFPLCLGLGNVLISDTLATPNDVSCLDIVLPTWVMAQLGRALGYKIGAATASTTVPFYAVATPLAVTLSLSATCSSSPTVSGQGYTVASGALTCIHDGRSMMEAGFHNQTNNLGATAYAQGATGASPNPLGNAGVYYYVATWEWTDAQGRLHRSRPSRAAYVSTGSASFYGAQVTVPSLNTVRGLFTGNNALQSVTCRLYRSVMGATDRSFYLVNSQTVWSFGQTNGGPTAWYGNVIADNVLPELAVISPTSLQDFLQNQPQIYTGLSSAYTGSLFSADGPPAFLWQASSKGRAFGLAVVQGQPRIYYSSVMSSGVPFEWNALNYAPVPTDIGDARSIDCMDDKVLVFGSRSVGFMSGDGPLPYNSVGVPAPNDGFGLVYPIPTSLGVLGTGAPCRMADGIIFQGGSGFQLVSRALMVQDAGVTVDFLTGRQINNPGQVYSRGIMVSSLQAIVWCNPHGSALVYQYITKKWATWPLLAGANAIAQRFDGSVVVSLQPVVGVKYSPRAVAATAGADIGTLGNTYSPIYQGLQTNPGLVLETPWMYPAGESAGESALFDVAVTGTYFAPHILQVEQAYNGMSYVSQVIKFNVSSRPNQYQFRVRPVGGTRIWSVRYRISVLPATTLGAGYNMAGLSDLVLFAGSKQGTTRLLAGQSG